ncbi:hypothetical protein EV659_10335 [Rhodothalassium salexigens DSM 2132]|uniref:Uncharacterized protein n=1 Tax=Rhodothalassium salexigens DSM 2132 TaxID=1188247 RepID=A0A4R2PN13_RHOSA|nr:hypothetical protein [Rhodothalassium salexigens]MBB4211196.1 hypothetical protein [Rhodothalassium salexigens DSM 2132]TCP36148.1 hypothetical protein EV659_10335 [Rhodothalassium salexigens DSM 2132]
MALALLLLTAIEPGSAALAQTSAPDAGSTSAGDRQAIAPLEETMEDPRTGANAKPVEIVLDNSLHGSPDAKEPGFLYFDDSADNAPAGPTITVGDGTVSGLTPRLYFTPRGQAGGAPGPIVAGGLTTTGASSRISFNGLTGSAATDGLSVAVTSAVMQRPNSGGTAAGAFDFQLSPLDETVSLGLSLGYWGFNLDANVMRETALFTGNVEGIDLGLGYSWDDFSTSISVGEFRQDDLGVGGPGLVDDINYYKMELGATYQLTRSFHLSGGVQHFEYGQQWRAFSDRQRFQLLYLSGQLRF